MSFATKSDAIDARRKIPASDVKKLGWRGVMRDVQKSGRVVATNHDAPEAVTRRTQSADAKRGRLREACVQHGVAGMEIQIGVLMQP
ncbi:hypothetical protein DEO45_14165 [Rhodanobacter denitrificans]|uniref:Uncharacterized protein n=1 Tax=Rhodanobacter denitrificans TaxID=666685 RepID=A0A368KDU8_9GAMM|nr:hypothetical protein [Rhodanobacter denitrificans]RCS28843.1 hypothetical protein DEO45_14165 [Rhodanobacter denitrificans]